MLDREGVFGKRDTVFSHSRCFVLYYDTQHAAGGTDLVEAGQRGRGNNDSV